MALADITDSGQVRPCLKTRSDQHRDETGCLVAGQFYEDPNLPRNLKSAGATVAFGS